MKLENLIRPSAVAEEDLTAGSNALRVHEHLKLRIEDESLTLAPVPVAEASAPSFEFAVRFFAVNHVDCWCLLAKCLLANHEQRRAGFYSIQDSSVACPGFRLHVDAVPLFRLLDLPVIRVDSQRDIVADRREQPAHHGEPFLRGGPNSTVWWNRRQ